MSDEVTKEMEIVELELVNELNESQILQLKELYQHAWWAKDRSTEDIREMLSHTDFIFGFTSRENGDLVAFARVLSDWTFFALIFDVIVAPAYRHKGFGDQVIKTVKNHPIIARVQNIELCCLDDMKPFYERHGFSEGTGRMHIRRKRGVQPADSADLTANQ